MAQKTWGGRFTGGTDARVEQFTESISVDRRLYRHDARASQAHARMLAAVGLLTADEAEQICQCLDRTVDRIDRGEMEFSTALEDIHTHVETAMVEELGDVGRKLHTARSRNDQVSTDLRLWLRDAIDRLDGRLRELQRAFLASARRDRDVVIPAYTHLQRAQPVSAAHYYLAYVEKFHRDRERLADARKRVNILPLGSAALAGTSLPIDRFAVARDLGFAGVARNSLDASGDRDFALETAAALSICAVHLSGWAEEWVIWSTTEFGFLELPDAFCTGSSLMPHKKNPDVLELVRGKSARVIAALQQLLVLTKSLPLAYNRDLQEDKPPLFDAVDTVEACLTLAAALVRETRLRADRIAAGLDAGFLDATTVMERLIAEGVPMRTAHELVGKLVKASESRGGRLEELPREMFEDVRPGLADRVYPVMGAANAMAAFVSYGSTAPAEVDRQLIHWTEQLH